MTRPYFPVAIDSTMLGSFRSCPQKAFRQYVQHWKPAAESVHLVAGGAFAEGIEVARRAYYERKASVSDSVAEGLMALVTKYGDFECPADSAKSLERTAGALEFYFQNYPLDGSHAIPVSFSNGQSGIEFSFAVPLPINHPVTGDPLLYTGRSDMIAESYGGIYIYDEKTTSSLGPSWAKQWDMRSQFTGYCWAARHYGIEAAGVVVRGVSILKTKYDTQEVMTYRSPYEVDRWLDQTCRDIQRMIRCWEEGYWDFNLDHACSEYGGCALQTVCKSNDPETWLNQYFTQRVWNPLAREEQSLAQYNEYLAGFHA